MKNVKIRHKRGLRGIDNEIDVGGEVAINPHTGSCTSRLTAAISLRLAVADLAMADHQDGYLGNRACGQGHGYAVAGCGRRRWRVDMGRGLRVEFSQASWTAIRITPTRYQ